MNIESVECAVEYQLVKRAINALLLARRIARMYDYPGVEREVETIAHELSNIESDVLETLTE